jgi:intergrase/recombinase
MYKGTPTNNLTIMLTNSNKKIKSGALSETTPRSVVYSHIQNMGLQAQCVTRFGRNYTQVPTASLIALINDANKNTEKKCECNNETERLVDAFTALIDTLEFNDHISYLEANELREILGTSKGTPKDKEVYSQEELDEMFDFVNKN